MALQINPNSNTAVSSADTIGPAAVPPTQHSAPPIAESHPADTVKLSLAAHVHQLKNQGQSPSQIATSLGISAQIVSSYLGTSLPKPANITVPQPAVVSSPHKP